MVKNFVKKLSLSMLFALLGSLMIAGVSLAADKEVEVKDGEEFVKAWNDLEYGYIANYDAFNGTVIKLLGDAEVSEELNMEFVTSMEFNVIIDLNGHKLTGTADDEDYFLHIENKLCVTIMDSSSNQNGELAVRCIDYDAAEYDDIIMIEEGGKLILESGNIVGNDDHLCGAVNVQDDGYFEMNGGCIRNNKFNGHNEASFATSYNGAAVAVDDGKFVMNGGVIRDNIVNGKGAAVVIDCDNSNSVEGDFGFEMRGGLITNNQVWTVGGGAVVVNDGRASFTGGLIDNNCAAATAYSMDEAIDFESIEESASGIFISTTAESCYFGGDFECRYVPGDPTCKTMIIYSSDPPVFGGNVKIKGVVLNDSWYRFSSPGITCDSTLNTSAKDHAWIGLLNVDDDTRLFTDIDEDEYATDINLAKCFYIGKGYEESSGYYINWNSPYSFCAVYKNDEFKYIGVVEADDYNEAPNCTLVFDKDKVKDKDGNPAKFDLSVDDANNSFTLFTNDYESVDTSNVSDWINFKFPNNCSPSGIFFRESYQLPEGVDDPYSRTFIYEVLNTVNDGSYSYRKVEYAMVTVSSGQADLEYRLGMNPSGIYIRECLNANQKVTLRAEYPETSNCFKSWSIEVIYNDRTSQFNEWYKNNITEEMLHDPELTFKMPKFSIKVTANYEPGYAITGEGVKAYRVEEDKDDVLIADVQKEGTHIRLETDETEYPLWQIFRIERDESGKVTGRTDVTTELIGKYNADNFIMPAYDIEIAFTVDGKVEFNADYANITVNGSDEVMTGRFFIPKSENTVLNIVLDEEKAAANGKFTGWDLKITCNDGRTYNAYEYVPAGASKSFVLDFKDLAQYLEAATEIKLETDFITTVDFDSNGGTGSMDSVTRDTTVKYRLPECEFTAPEGMRFVGWSLEKGSEIFPAGRLVSVKGVTTLYANWEETPEFLKVTFHSNDGTNITRTYSVGSGDYVLPGCMFKIPENKVFLGWSYKPDGEVISDINLELSYDTGFYAIWKDDESAPEEELFSITYSLNGAPGVAPTQESLKSGETFTVKDAPEREGYDFAGWNDGLRTYQAGDIYTVKNSDIVFMARWKKAAVESFSVTFEMNGHGTQIDSQSVEKGACAVKPEDPEEDGYTFLGWYSDPELTLEYDFSAAIDQDTEIYAKWAEESTEITGKWMKNSKGWWFSCSDGSYLADGIYEIDSVNYAFNEKGYMITGWYKDADGDWYHFATSGAMEYGWLKVGTKWYYLDPDDGVMIAGGLWPVNDVVYCFDESGAMVTGWFKYVDEDLEYWYHFATSGAMDLGWTKVGTKWYYLDPETGVMQTGWIKLNGEEYCLDGSGAMVTGWYEYDGTWYHFASSGKLDTAKWIGDYYVDEIGRMLTSAYVKNGDKYYWVNKDGKYTGTYSEAEEGYEVYDQATGRIIWEDEVMLTDM